MIYAIHAETTAFVKIGITARHDISLRLTGLQNGNPHKLIVLGTAHWPDSTERNIHRFLKAYRVRGEWFRMEGKALEVLAAIKIGTEGMMALRKAMTPGRVSRAPRTLSEATLSSGTRPAHRLNAALQFRNALDL